jgi:hypothetical protein
MVLLVWVAFPFCLFVLLSWCMQAAKNRHQFKQAVCSGCDSCDFTPRQVRDFYVTSARGEQLVNEFYKQLELSLEELADVEPQFVSLSHPLALLHHLYAQPALWQKLDRMLQQEKEDEESGEQSDGDRDDGMLGSWLYTMTYTFSHYVRACLGDIDTLKKGENMGDVLAKCIEFHDGLIRFSKLYIHPLCPLTHTKLRASILQLALALSSDHGFLPGLLVFAHLRPDMVNEHCYPKINNETTVYNSLSMQQLDEFEKLHYLADKYEEYVIL